MDNVRSVERALDILLAFAQSPTQKVSEIQASVGLSRPTLYRLLNTLENKGLLRSFGEPREYQLNHRIAELANAWMSVVDFAQVSQPFLRQMWTATNETVSLYQYDGGDQRVCLRELRSTNPLSFAPGLGARPLHVGAPGKAILAHLPQPAIDNILAAALATKKERDALNASLADIRTAGYAVSMGELILGGAAIAAPVFNRDNIIAGSVAVAVPQARLSEESRQELAKAVKETATTISFALGHPEQVPGPQ